MHRPQAALAFALLMAAAAPGTTLSGETTRDLVLSAERICCAAVESVESRKDPRSGFVFTHVRVRLLEQMKGTSEAPVIELRLPGGRADGLETTAPGMPRFEVGAEAVLLLGPRNRDGFPVVLQASGGVLPLRADKAGRRCLRVPATGFKELLGEQELTLDSFRAAVGRVLREQAEKAAAPSAPAITPRPPGEPVPPGAAGPPSQPGANEPPAEPAPGATEPPEPPADRTERPRR